MIKLFKRKQDLMQKIYELQKALEISNTMLEDCEERLKCEIKESKKWKEACHYWYIKAQEK